MFDYGNGQGTTNSAPANTNGGKQDKEKRQGIAFINLYVPTKDGSRIRLVSDLTLRMYAENTGDAKLVDLIKSGQITEEQLGKLIQVEVKLARDPNAEIEFDLSAITV